MPKGVHTLNTIKKYSPLRVAKLRQVGPEQGHRHTPRGFERYGPIGGETGDRGAYKHLASLKRNPIIITPQLNRAKDAETPPCLYRSKGGV
jgi:hypothetical protein